MKAKPLITAALACAIVATSFAAEMPKEPRGGHPPEDVKSSSAAELDDQ